MGDFLVFLLRGIVTAVTVLIAVLAISFVWWGMMDQGLHLFNGWTGDSVNSFIRVFHTVGGLAVLLTTVVIEGLIVVLLFAFLKELWD